MSRFGIVKKISMVLSVTMCVQAVSMLGVAKNVHAAEPIDLKLEVKSAILMEASTGQVIYESNADEALPPASMSKMMTEYLVLDGIQSGKHKWDETVTASKYAKDVIGSGGLIAEGEKLTIKDLFSAMSIYSANDASVALAEYYGGTEEKFAQMMNDKAKELGLSDKAHFINATGLTRADIGKYAPMGIQGETMMTSRDVATLAYRVIKDHKEVLDFTKITSQKLRPKDATPMINWNWMLEGNSNNVNFKKFAYPGLDGLKTGHTAEAGFCFTGTAERNGMRLISVVMGTQTEPKRFEETRKLLDYGFNNFELKKIVDANSSVDAMKTVPVKKGKETEVPVVTQTPITVVEKKGANNTPKITVEPVDSNKLVAPIEKGKVMAIATVEYDGKKQQINMIASQSVEKGGFVRLFFRGIKDFFANLLGQVKNKI